MKKSIAVFMLFFIGILATQTFAQDGLVTLKSEYSVEETTDRLKKILTENGLTIFKEVNHTEGANSVNINLAPTTVLIFGNPKLGTPLMKCARTTAIDLPQKMLVWEDADSNVHIGFNAPDYLKQRHNIQGCNQELNKISNALGKFARSAAGKN